jgi:hypothetical protein
MKLEINENYVKVELKNVLFKDFRLDVEFKKRELERHTIYFNSITLLKGEKLILEQAFQDEKKETLENYG